MARLFFAIETPSALKKELIILQDSIALRLQKLDPVPNFKPEKLVNSHCTIRFLGSVEESNVESLITEVRNTITNAGIASFECKLITCGVFPNRNHARVFWVGLSPEEPFQQIQRAIDDGVAASWVPIKDERAFHPHLTLFRFRNPYCIPSDFEFPNFAGNSQTATMSEVLLIESKTFASGPVHTICAKFVLQ